MLKAPPMPDNGRKLRVDDRSGRGNITGITDYDRYSYLLPYGIINEAPTGAAVATTPVGLSTLKTLNKNPLKTPLYH